MAQPLTSPWAQVAPDQSAPPAPVQMTDPSSASVPQVFAPSAAPSVKLAPQPPTPIEQNISNDQQQLQKVRWEKTHGWGTDPTYDASGTMTDPGNHPGKLGKLAHVFSTLGNIAGDIFAPTVMANIPGTQMNRDLQEHGLAKRLNTEVDAQAQNQHLGAETAGLEESTKEAPGKTASEEGLQGAQTANLQSETAERANPSLQIHDTEDGPILVNPKTGDAQHVTLDGQPVGPKLKLTQSQPIMGPDGKPHTYMIDEKGNKKVDLGVHFEKPSESGMITMIAPDPNTPGGGIVQRLGAGAHITPGSQTAAGVNSMNTPTTNQRTAAGRAETVIAMAPEVLSRIDAVGSQMGPIAGRWNDFMQGKVGAPNEQFAALRSDLLMMSSAVALAHAQGRLPENLRQEFDHAINAPNQTPENLKATINTMIPWLQQVQSQGERPGAQPAAHPAAPAGAPAAGTVENGFRFKGGDPSKQENWVKQ
jgi:hypothetical protein